MEKERNEQFSRLPEITDPEHFASLKPAPITVGSASARSNKGSRKRWGSFVSVRNSSLLSPRAFLSAKRPSERYDKSDASPDQQTPVKE